MSRYESVVAAENHRILEAWSEMTIGGFAASGLPNNSFAQYGGMLQVLPAAGFFWGSGFGNGSWTSAINPTNGFLCMFALSQLNFQKGIVTALGGFPLARSYGVAPVITAAEGWPLRRYYMSAYLWRDALSATCPLWFGLNNSGTELDVASTATGFDLFSLSGLNGGNWTLRAKIVEAGAPVNVLDTGVSPLVPALVEWIYTESLNPTLEVRIGGVSIHTFTGQAELVQAAGITVLNSRWCPRIAQGRAAGGSAAGASDWVLGGHYYIEDLGA